MATQVITKMQKEIVRHIALLKSPYYSIIVEGLHPPNDP